MMYNYRNELIAKEKRKRELVNLITNYAIENQMSAKDVDECVEIVKEVFYSDGLVRRS